MRKLLLLAVAALLLVAIAAPSFAAETTVTGSYRIRGVSEWNFGKVENTLVGAAGSISVGHDAYTGYFDQRFRLTITHKRSEFLKAVVSIDLVEDVWGQQRNFRINGSGDATNGLVNTAYIEAITKVGLFKLGVDNLGGRFGMGTWSDSGMKNGAAGNPGITWGMKIDNFIATVTYVKYVDLVDTIFANKGGKPWYALQVWPGGFPGNTRNVIGGKTSDYYNADLNTWVMTAHYVTDAAKVGFLYQVIRDPKTISAPFLVGGISDQNFFAGEATAYGALATAYGAGWPTPTGAFGTVGFGRTGMYSSWLHIMALYTDLKFLDGKLEFKGEYDRIWGYAKLNSRGDAYNTYLGTTTLPAIFRLQDVTVDGHTLYADLSYDFDVAKVGMAFLYGAGEAEWKPFSQSHYHFNTTGNDDFHWGNIIVPGDSALLPGVSPLGLGNSPENVTSIKLYGSFMPTEKWDIHGAVIWAQYTEAVGRYAGGTYTRMHQPFYGHPMNYTLAGDGTEGQYVPAHVSHELGWELDAGATYQIMEGLSLNSEFGVLFTGNAFDYMNPATGAVSEWGPIYRWVNTLTYEF